MDNPTTSYRNLPPILHTKEELYSLVVAAAQVFRTKTQASRMAVLSITYLDLADEYFLSWLEGNTKPAYRQPVRKGKEQRETVELELPISKSIAFYIARRGLIHIICLKTTEEKENIKLESWDELQEKE